jgi:hypothetical protein
VRLGLATNQGDAMTTRLLGQRETIYDTTTYARQDCIHCGVIFYWPAELDRQAKDHQRTFYCPGCRGSMQYHETEAMRLKKQLDAAKESAQFARDEAQRQREHRLHADRRVTAMKGVVTRTKKRIASGKCVRCSCEFPDLAEHMAEAHPDYAPESDA